MRRYVPAADAPEQGAPRVPEPSEAQRFHRTDAEMPWGKEEEQFSNACQPPAEAKPVVIPKTLAALREQVGESFRVARRGPFLVAADLDREAFATLVDGVIACCRQCLRKDYFTTEPDRVITVYVLRNEATYTAYLRLLFHMDPISPYGHYGYSQRYIVVNYDTGPGTLVHEMTHALMAPDFPQAPIWISEGLASLYEQCRVENDSLKGDPNWRLPELRRALDAGTTTSLAKLMAMDVSEFRAKQESLHYAESRYFCKFMEERGVLRQVYSTFRDRHAEDLTGKRFVEKAFGLTLDLIEAEWHAWLKTQQSK